MSLEILDDPLLSYDDGTAGALYVLEVTLIGDDGRSPLLAAASVLHRRGIDVVEATLTTDRLAGYRFTATFRCRPAQARTVQHTFGNRADTQDVTLHRIPTDRLP
ncbi:MAG: hypothetical protein ABW137_32145 [Mycobacterium sp.]